MTAEVVGRVIGVLVEVLDGFPLGCHTTELRSVVDSFEEYMADGSAEIFGRVIGAPVRVLEGLSLG